MSLEKRYLSASILEDLSETMVFLGGPRQVGKTTLAEGLIGAHYRHAYYNWDQAAHRREALQGKWPTDTPLIILDEFHKYPKWKSWIKGEYDTHKLRHRFLLTGSARLDIYRRGGDSLQGRYHYYRLHPFSLAELQGTPRKIEPFEELQFSTADHSSDYEALLRFGGFPMPLLKQSERTLRRWNNERLERLIREDIRDLSMIQDVGNLSLLIDLLPERVASILSINSLAEDLQVNYRTMANWLTVLERLYFCFRLAPYQSRKINSVRKEKKLYLWDWSPVPSPAAKLENMMASHLFKFCHWLHDTEGWKAEVYFLRDSQGREVDFLVTVDEKPWFAVEVKSQERQVSKQLQTFQEKLKIPYCYQISGSDKVDYESKKVRVIPAEKFLSALI